MKAESRILSAIYAALLLAVISFVAGCADTTQRTLVAPRGPSSEAYLEVVRGKGLQTGISYRSAEEEVADVPDTRADGDFSMGKLVGWGLLGLLILVLVILAYRSRNVLAELGGSQGARVLPAGAQPKETEKTAIDHDLVDQLRVQPDPREGLRMVLQRFLVLAAQQNSIPLKRSLTTREIMQRLPGGFAHRDALETLASEVERVVFGGHAIDPEQYQHCLDLAVPFLRRAEP